MYKKQSWWPIFNFLYAAECSFAVATIQKLPIVKYWAYLGLGLGFALT